MSEAFIRAVDLKLARAKAHIVALNASIDKWKSENPATPKVEFLDGRLGYRVRIDYSADAPVEEWGLIIGDFVHNLRSALDNLAFGLARLHCDPPTRPRVIAFPIFLKEAEFRGKAGPALDQMPAQAARLIETIQPFKRDGSPMSGVPDSDGLVFLNMLSNADKHQVPSVVLMAPTGVEFDGQVEFYSEEHARLNTPPDTTFFGDPIARGSILLEHRAKNPISKVKGSFRVPLAISLRTPRGILRLEQTLPGLESYANLVVDQFRPLFSTTHA